MATPPLAYYGISASTDVGDIKNLEVAYINYPANNPARVRLTSGNPRTLANGAIREDGHLNGELVIDLVDCSGLDTLIYAVIGGWTTPSVERAVSLMDEQGYYSPFLAHVGKPAISYPTGGYWRTQVTFRLSNLRLQSVTKTGNYTVTADDRLIYCNTTSGSITLALPAAASVQTYSVYSAVKTAAGNSLTLNPDGSEEIENASTYAATAQYARVDYYSDGSAWWIKAPG